ncbi:momilactone A synthase-like [Magnolia sinica]|uniref:momilactone A synthase-like n=1 Tax=Magnolia sinica TaxID=86752 RepID=UPI002657E23F|nr:momilactone A synthase-like [Magnolia sinica]
MMRLGFRRSYLGLKEWSVENRLRRFSTESARLADKVVLITGGASGVGKATATEFIRNGAKVIIADIQQKLGAKTAMELGPNATFVHCNVTQESDISSAVDFAVLKHGHLDVMYNNAGISGTLVSGIADLDLEEFDQVMKVNVRSVIAGIKHAARVMVPRQTGCILCTASVAGILGSTLYSSYGVSKFAVVGIVKSVAAELSKYGIRVNCISPPTLPTPLALSAFLQFYPGLDVGRLTEIINESGEIKGVKFGVDDIAKAALYLASDDGKYVSGHNLVVDGSFTTSKSFPFPALDEVMK